MKGREDGVVVYSHGRQEGEGREGRGGVGAAFMAEEGGFMLCG